MMMRPPVQLFQRGVLEPLGNGHAGIVHKYIELAEGRDDLLDRGVDGASISGVRLDRDSLSSIEFNRFDHGGSRTGVLRVCDGHIRPVRSQTFRDRGTNATRAAGNECYFIG
jgi:hypothetical protein